MNNTNQFLLVVIVFAAFALLTNAGNPMKKMQSMMGSFMKKPVQPQQVHRPPAPQPRVQLGAPSKPRPAPRKVQRPAPKKPKPVVPAPVAPTPPAPQEDHEPHALEAKDLLPNREHQNLWKDEFGCDVFINDAADVLQVPERRIGMNPFGQRKVSGDFRGEIEVPVLKDTTFLPAPSSNMVF